MISATFRPTKDNPFDGIDEGNNSSPVFADIDNDGDLDLVIGNEDGTLDYYENTGGANAPAYVLRTGAPILSTALTWGRNRPLRWRTSTATAITIS